MKKSNQICWQKYEDVLESQVNSPLLDRLYKAASSKLFEENIEEQSYAEGIDEQVREEDQSFFMLDKDFSAEIMLATNYDCWLGHTNFNITEKIKKKLNEVEGVEVLKVCSRYRFFIGVGRMFDFSNVRGNIEKTLY